MHIIICAWGTKKGNERRLKDVVEFPRIMVSITQQIDEDEGRFQTQIVSETGNSEDLMTEEPERRFTMNQITVNYIHFFLVILEIISLVIVSINTDTVAVLSVTICKMSSSILKPFFMGIYDKFAFLSCLPLF